MKIFYLYIKRWFITLDEGTLRTAKSTLVRISQKYFLKNLRRQSCIFLRLNFEMRIYMYIYYILYMFILAFALVHIREQNIVKIQ